MIEQLKKVIDKTKCSSQTASGDEYGFYRVSELKPIVDQMVKIVEAAIRYHESESCSCDDCFQCDFDKELAALRELVSK